MNLLLRIVYTRSPFVLADVNNVNLVLLCLTSMVPLNESQGGEIKDPVPYS